MRTIFLFITICAFFISSAQQVQLKIEDRDLTFEEYFVLSSDSAVKHGSYLMITKPMLGFIGDNYLGEIGNYKFNKKHGVWESFYLDCNQIEYRGYYNEGVKDSLWFFYYPDGDIKEIKEIDTSLGKRIEVIDINEEVSSKGHYKKGKRVGVWEYYNPEQDLVQQFDFDNHKLLYDRGIGDLNNRPLTFIGGDNEMKEYFLDLFEFHDLFDRIANKRKLKTGVITIEFDINRNGHISNRRLTEDSIEHKKFSKHSLRFLDKIENQWVPKLENGEAKSSRVKIYIKLMVEEKSENSGYGEEFFTEYVLDFQLETF